MSSNDSMSSSRLSQFGLYRTIDARTEEFLKLSRRRQVRQGCACAAVSAAVTVAVVVSMLFLYGYGIGSSSSPNLRNPSWLDLMNDTSDSTLFDDKFKSSIKFDQASMNLLPVFFDKVLENHESSSQKYEAVTDDIDFQRNIFSGTKNWAKLPTSGLYSIQYKTYPVLYIQRPRNTDYYMKVRKTREYERIMSYIDKMINEKVGLGSSRSMAFEYPTTTEENIETKTVWPEPVKHKISRVLTKPKENNHKKNILPSKNIPKQATPNVKYNYTKMIDHKKKCKCQNQFGTLLSKLFRCLQEVIKDSSADPPCNKKTENKEIKMVSEMRTDSDMKMPSKIQMTSEIKMASEMKEASKMKNQNTERQTIISTTVATTTSTTQNIRPIQETTPKSISLSYLLSYSTTPAPSAPLRVITTTATPKEVFHFEDSFSQKSILTDNTKMKHNDFLNQMSPLYTITENKNSQNNILNSNNLLPIKPKQNILATINQNYKDVKAESSKNVSFSSLERKYDVQNKKIRIPTTTGHDSEEVIQNLLFPKSKEIGFKNLPQKIEKKYPFDDLSSRNYQTAPEKIKPLKTMTPQTDKNKKVSPPNISGTNSKPYAPIIPSINKIPFPGKTPEDYIMERFRHDNNNMKLSTAENEENKRDKSSDGSMFAKIKDLLKAKFMQPRRKIPYNLSPQLKNSKTEPRLPENMQMNLPKQVKINTNTKLTDNLQAFQTVRTESTTTTSPSKSELDTVPTQLGKYSQGPLMPEMTTLPTVANYDTFLKVERRNLPYTNPEDVWTEDDIYKTATMYDNAHVDSITTSPKKNISAQTSSTERITYDIRRNDIRRKAAASNDIQIEPARLNNSVSAFNNAQNTWEEPPPPEDNYTPYMIPIGRKSYLEISRGDWKQREPHVDDTNVIYDALDTMEK